MKSLGRILLKGLLAAPAQAGAAAAADGSEAQRQALEQELGAVRLRLVSATH